MISLTEYGSTARIEPLPENELFHAGSRFAVLRLDLLHPRISGNKWFKLQGYAAEAQRTGKTALVTFGGAWSNHLVSVATAGKELHLKTTGIVRGEAPATPSPSLQDMRQLGMDLRFVDRQRYRSLQREENFADLQAEYPDAVVVPEGGRGNTGRDGAAEIAHLPGMEGYTHLCVAVGTGTTIAGLAKGSKPLQRLVGVPVLRGTTGSEPLPPEWTTAACGGDRIQLVHGFDEGGYARNSPGLLQFMNRFYDQFAIPSDFVYTGKLFFAIARLSFEEFFPPGSNVLMIHSGGLQGNRSLPAHSLHF